MSPLTWLPRANRSRDFLGFYWVFGIHGECYQFTVNSVWVWQFDCRSCPQTSLCSHVTELQTTWHTTWLPVWCSLSRHERHITIVPITVRFITTCQLYCSTRTWHNPSPSRFSLVLSNHVTALAALIGRLAGLAAHSSPYCYYIMCGRNLLLLYQSYQSGFLTPFTGSPTLNLSVVIPTYFSIYPAPSFLPLLRYLVTSTLGEVYL